MSTIPQEDEFQERFNYQLWSQLLKRTLPYKRFLITLLIAAALIACCDAGFGLITRWAVDDIADSLTGAVSLLPYASSYFGLMVIYVITVYVFIMMAGSLSNHMSHDIRAASFARIQELEFAYFDHRPMGWLISRLTADCDKLARIIAWGCLDFVWATSLVIIIGIVLLVLNFKLGLLVLSVVPLLIWISAVFQKKLLLSSRETRKYNSMITASFTEGLQGNRTTKSFVQEGANFEGFKTLSNQMYVASVRNAIQSAIYIPIVLLLGSIAAGLVLWRGGLGVLQSEVTLGTLIAFIFYAGQFFNPINQIASVLVQMQGAQAAGERVLGLLSTEPRIKDSPEVIERLRSTNNSDTDVAMAEDGLEAKIKSIEFKQVDFGYLENELILNNFNLKVSAGETIALVGTSGGGKSTIVNLAARFYEPTGGSVLINEVDYRDRGLLWYQSNLGIVLQSPHLFHGSVKDNIRYGRLDASDDEVINAARLVNADAFIQRLEKGYDTDVGEGGNRLSTGEKQLLSFARAILADPQIFIMDEATSSIDTETEQLIQKSLEVVFKGRISFVIAHRLSTIRNADRILVIDNGSIVESGTHDSLLHSKGAYYKLYTRQFTQEIETSTIETG